MWWCWNTRIVAGAAVAISATVVSGVIDMAPA
jgi:hypothetical protein